MKFDWNKILQKRTIVRPCTYENAKELLNEAEEKGLTWCNGESYKKNDNWKYYKENICYNLNEGVYGRLNFYKDKGCKILSYEDILLPEKKPIKEMNIIEAVKYLQEHPEANIMSVYPDSSENGKLCMDDKIYIEYQNGLTSYLDTVDIKANYILTEPRLKYTHAELMDRTKWWIIKERPNSISPIEFYDSKQKEYYIDGEAFTIEECSENLIPYNPEEEEK